MLKKLTKLICGLGASSLALYSVISVLLYFCYPFYDNIDTNLTFASAYHSEEAHLLTGRRVLMNDRANIFIMGASGSRKGFPSAELEKDVRGPRINNISIDASNMRQMMQTASLIYEVLPESAYEKSTFVITTTYHYYLDDDSRWSERNGKSNLECEMEKFALYRNVDGKWYPNLPPFIMKYSDLLLLPHFFFNKLPLYKYIYSTRAEYNLKEMGFENMPLFSQIKTVINPLSLIKIITTPEDTNKIEFTEEDMEKANRLWEERFDSGEGLSKNQFEILKTLAEEILSKGSTLIILDMPIPEWQYERSKYFKSYQEMKKPYFENILKHDNAFYINLQDLSDNNDFMNSTHPRNRTVSVWCKRLADELNRISKTK